MLIYTGQMDPHLFRPMLNTQPMCTEPYYTRTVLPDRRMQTC